MNMHIIHTAADDPSHADLLDRVPVPIAYLVAIIIDVAGLVVMVFLASWLLTLVLAAGVVVMKMVVGG